MKLLISMCAALVGLCAAKDEPLTFVVDYHQPCRGAIGKRAKLVFPKKDLEKGRKPGCYILGGAINVKEKVSGPLQVYTEITHGVGGSKEQCHEFDNSTGCGGYGSCLYCDMCGKKFDELSDITRKASFRVDNRPLNCNEGLDPDSKNKVKFSLCLPTRNQFLRSSDMNRKTWNEMVKTKTDGGCIPIALTTYFFNERMDPVFLQQYKRLESVRRELGLAPGAIVPESDGRQKTFQKFIKRSAIACHKYIGKFCLTKKGGKKAEKQQNLEDKKEAKKEKAKAKKKQKKCKVVKGKCKKRKGCVCKKKGKKAKAKAAKRSG